MTQNGSVVYNGAMVTYTGYNVASPFGTSAISAVGTLATSPAAGTLSPAPGAQDMVVRFYAWAQNNNATGATCSSPGGTWATRANLVTAAASGQFQDALVVADKIAGTDNQTITANSVGGWLVIDVPIKAAIALSRGITPVRAHPGRGPTNARFLQTARSTEPTRPSGNYADQFLPHY